MITQSTNKRGSHLQRISSSSAALLLLLDRRLVEENSSVWRCVWLSQARGRPSHSEWWISGSEYLGFQQRTWERRRNTSSLFGTRLPKTLALCVKQTNGFRGRNGLKWKCWWEIFLKSQLSKNRSTIGLPVGLLAYLFYLKKKKFSVTCLKLPEREARWKTYWNSEYKLKWTRPNQKRLLNIFDDQNIWEVQPTTSLRTAHFFKKKNYKIKWDQSVNKPLFFSSDGKDLYAREAYIIVRLEFVRNHFLFQCQSWPFCCFLLQSWNLWYQCHS